LSYLHRVHVNPTSLNAANEPVDGMPTRERCVVDRTHSAAHENLDAFTAVVREHQAGLRAYIRALGAQDVWVDDLAQEVFLVAYRRRGHFDSDADQGRWLRGIARNLVLNERRKTARRSRLLHDSIIDVLAREEESIPLDATTQTRLLQAMTDCISRLPARAREMLQRRYADSIDASALGRMLRLNPAAIRQTLMRTRAAVRRCIETKLGEAWL
jgi:RNA polymerase sigma-70 factor, ECF subfamily